MIPVTSSTRIVVAVEPVDFRNGIDGLARICKQVLQADPFSGWLFLFRSRRATAIKALYYDGQGFYLIQKRLSAGRFRYWPGDPEQVSSTLQAHQLQVLLAAGDPSTAKGAPVWKPIRS
jgi:transposase